MPAPSTHRGFLSGAATLLALALVAVVFWWTVGTTGARLRPLPEHSDYYNLLMRGFADGHTYMQAPLDPRLLALPEAERPGGAPFLFDASLYRDRYYLYFGVVPVLAVQLPFHLLTGMELPEASVAAVFGLAALAAGLLWWLEIRRRWLSNLTGLWDVLFVLALGLCSALPSTLRRPAFYEVAIAAGCTFTLLALWAATRACANPRRAIPWLCLAGVAIGLAVGSRANLGPAGLLMLAVAAVLVGTGSTGPEKRWRFMRGLGAAAVGAGAVGSGLMAYNFARFGNPLEFGHRYQLGINPKQFFHLANLWHNLRLYYGLPPAINGYFPFIAPGDEGSKPDDYIGREHVHGELVWLAVAIAAAAAWLASRRRRGPGEALPGWPLLLPAVLFGANLLLTASTGVRANRYMLDFHPALVALTLGFLGFAVAPAGWGRGLLRVLAVAGVAVAAAFNLLASLQAQGFYRLSDPVGFRWLATWTNQAVALVAAPPVVDRVARITWPENGGGWRREPLLSAGTMDFEDVLLLEYDGVDKVRVMYEHGEYGPISSEWFVYPPRGESSVRVGGAFLLPPVTHPWYGERSAEERWALKRHLRVQVDGVDRLSRDVPSYDSSPRLLHWGVWHAAATKPNLTRIVPAASPAVDDAWKRQRLSETGAFRFTAVLPRDRFGASEPLLQAGVLGRFDTLAVRYTGPDRIQIVHDQLGAGATVSEEIPIDYSKPQEVEIETPVASDGLVWTDKGPVESGKPPAGFRVRWNGREVFAPALAPVPTTRGAVAIGTNAWKASSAFVMFSGQLAERDALTAAGTAGAGALEARLPSRPWLGSDRGILARFGRADGEKTALLWRSGTAPGSFQLGWLEAGETTWSRLLDRATAPIDLLHLELPAGSGWIEVEADGRSILSHKSEFFSAGAASFAAILPGKWTGSALAAAAGKPAPPELPGRVRLRFIVPDAAGTDPLLVAGKTGAADLLYLKNVGNGRYVFGIDHWGAGVVESAPIPLAPNETHTAIVEMSSLFAAGTGPRPGIRLWCNGRLVWEYAIDLYPATPAQVAYGRKPDEMSTGFPTFRGAIISVRANEPAP